MTSSAHKASNAHADEPNAVLSSGRQTSMPMGLDRLIQLRFLAVAGQFLTLVAVWALQVSDMAYGRMMAIVGAVALSNLVLLKFARSQSMRHERTTAIVLAGDIVVLTALLAMSGGPMNPFTIFYLVHVVMAAVLLGAGWAWPFVGLSTACYGVLFFVAPVGAHVHHSGQALILHLYGMLTSFVAAAMCVGYFAWVVQRERERNERALAAARAEAARLERFAALTSLAAGAAHELATPLGTIAVASRELERKAMRTGQAPELLEDARLIRAEVDRCRLILDQMVPTGAEPTDQPPVEIPELAAELHRRLPRELARVLQIETAKASGKLPFPKAPLVQALTTLIRNAAEASPADAPIVLRCVSAMREVLFEVEDRGTGMPPDVLAHAGEPFMTTKSPGQGMGLGLFLVRHFASRFGGRVEFAQVVTGGTIVRLWLPREDLS